VAQEAQAVAAQEATQDQMDHPALLIPEVEAEGLGLTLAQHLAVAQAALVLSSSPTQTFTLHQQLQQDRQQ
jgi:hypothetical protein